MKIIMITGPHSCGKTTTINCVYDQMVTPNNVMHPRKHEGHDPNDFSAILEWKMKKIAFLSMGDFARVVMDKMDEYENLGCDVFITACNDRFTLPFQKIKTFPGHVIIKKHKLVDPIKRQNEINNTVAAIISNI